MATTVLERLLFLQGGLCFFCSQRLPKADASVEHLMALANGGTNHDDNCVACCKAVNRALGSMSLKAKIQVVLNQKGIFQCPNSAKDTAPSKAIPPKSIVAKAPDAFALVVANLKQRGSNNRPSTLKTLTSTISTLLAQHKSSETAESLIGKLKAAEIVLISERKVTYAF